MDCFARGLRNAVKIIEDGLFDKHIKVCSFTFLLLAAENSLVKHIRENISCLSTCQIENCLVAVGLTIGREFVKVFKGYLP